MEILRDTLAEKARELGMEACGVAEVPADCRRDYFLRWLAEEKHGDMHWLARDPERRLDARQVLPEARSILVFGVNYFHPEPERRGRIAKYALGADYHKIILKKLKKICLWLQESGGINRPYVDTGPVLEKPVAALAGLGWQGKNTMILNPDEGQWLFLGCILTTLSFRPSSPAKDRCGNCTRCIDVCPTNAIHAPYQLDARKCISYLTIEHKGAIPTEYRAAIGNHLYGCDDCLDICPWNRWAKISRETRFHPRPYPDLVEMLSWDEDTFRETFAGSPIKRVGLSRWKRNVCVVLGNIGTEEDLPSLRDAAQSEDPLIAEHAVWAIEEIGLRSALKRRAQR